MKDKKRRKNKKRSKKGKKKYVKKPIQLIDLCDDEEEESLCDDEEEVIICDDEEEEYFQTRNACTGSWNKKKTADLYKVNLKIVKRKCNEPSPDSNENKGKKVKKAKDKKIEFSVNSGESSQSAYSEVLEGEKTCEKVDKNVNMPICDIEKKKEANNVSELRRSSRIREKLDEQFLEVLEDTTVDGRIEYDGKKSKVNSDLSNAFTKPSSLNTFDKMENSQLFDGNTRVVKVKQDPDSIYEAPYNFKKRLKRRYNEALEELNGINFNKDINCIKVEDGTESNNQKENENVKEDERRILRTEQNINHETIVYNHKNVETMHGYLEPEICINSNNSENFKAADVQSENENNYHINRNTSEDVKTETEEKGVEEREINGNEITYTKHTKSAENQNITYNVKNLVVIREYYLVGAKETEDKAIQSTSFDGNTITKNALSNNLDSEEMVVGADLNKTENVENSIEIENSDKCKTIGTYYRKRVSENIYGLFKHDEPLTTNMTEHVRETNTDFNGKEATENNVMKMQNVFEVNSNSDNNVTNSSEIETKNQDANHLSSVPMNNEISFEIPKCRISQSINDNVSEKLNSNENFTNMKANDKENLPDGGKSHIEITMDEKNTYNIFLNRNIGGNIGKIISDSVRKVCESVCIPEGGELQKDAINIENAEKQTKTSTSKQMNFRVVIYRNETSCDIGEGHGVEKWSGSSTKKDRLNRSEEHDVGHNIEPELPVELHTRVQENNIKDSARVKNDLDTNTASANHACCSCASRSNCVLHVNKCIEQETSSSNEAVTKVNTEKISLVTASAASGSNTVAAEAIASHNKNKELTDSQKDVIEELYRQRNQVSTILWKEDEKQFLLLSFTNNIDNTDENSNEMKTNLGLSGTQLNEPISNKLRHEAEPITEPFIKKTGTDTKQFEDRKAVPIKVEILDQKPNYCLRSKRCLVKEL